VGVYGDVDMPRDEQIARGLRHAERERTHQREIVAAIEELRRLSDARPSPPGTAAAAASDDQADESTPKVNKIPAVSPRCALRHWDLLGVGVLVLRRR
jgi:hypothetical protein